MMRLPRAARKSFSLSPFPIYPSVWTSRASCSPTARPRGAARLRKIVDASSDRLIRSSTSLNRAVVIPTIRAGLNPKADGPILIDLSQRMSPFSVASLLYAPAPTAIPSSRREKQSEIWGSRYNGSPAPLYLGVLSVGLRNGPVSRYEISDDAMPFACNVAASCFRISI